MRKKRFAAALLAAALTAALLSGCAGALYAYIYTPERLNAGQITALESSLEQISADSGYPMSFASSPSMESAALPTSKEDLGLSDDEASNRFTADGLTSCLEASAAKEPGFAYNANDSALIHKGYYKLEPGYSLSDASGAFYRAAYDLRTAFESVDPALLRDALAKLHGSSPRPVNSLDFMSHVYTFEEGGESVYYLCATLYFTSD